MAMTVAKLTLATGVTLEYVERGDPNGTPVIFLHGVTDSWRSFEHVLPHLPRSIRAIALTQRGHGDSSRPDQGYAYGDFAADVAAFLDAMGMPRAVVVGHSMGGLVAQRFAIDHPDRTRGLVLLGTFATVTDHPDVQAMWDGTLATLVDPVDPAFVREFQESTLATADSGGPARHVRRREPQGAGPRVAGDLPRDSSTTTSQPSAPHHRADAGRLRRQGSARAAPGATALLAAIPGATASTIPAGHAMHWENPAAIARDIARFVGRLPAAAAHAARYRTE